MRRWGRWLVLAVLLGQLALTRLGVFAGPGLLWVAATLEMLIVAIGVWSGFTTWRTYRRERLAGSDVWLALENGLATLLPHPLARVAVLEPKLWYCLIRWIARRRMGADGFGYQRRALIGPILLLAILTLPAETFAIARLVPWPWLRLALLIGSVYSLFWMAGFYASLWVLPHRFVGNALQVHFGAFAEATIPLEAIEQVVRERRSTPNGRDGLNLSPQRTTAYLAVGGRTDVTLHLAQPISVQGLRGPTPPVLCLAVACDQPERFASEIARRANSVIVTAPPTPKTSRLLYSPIPLTR